MTETERVQRYTRVAVGLHWTIAALVLALIAAGWWMTRGEGAAAAAPGTARFAVYQLHKSLGILVLLLTLARLGWRLANRPPPLPEHLSVWERRLAAPVHWIFYALLIVLPLTGWALVSSSPTGIPTILFGVVSWPHLPLAQNRGVSDGFDLAHAWLAWIAASLVALHVAAALKHQLADKTNVLARMAPGLFGPTDPPATPARGAVLAIAAPVVLVLAAFVGEMAATSAARPAALDLAGDSAPTGAWSWSVNHDASSIAFSGVQNDYPFDGVFERWSAQIRFNPDDLADAHVLVTIDAGSAKTSNSFVNGSISSPAWLDAQGFPEARFEASDFTSTGPDAYEAAGRLTLKGVGADVTLPFALTIDGDTAHAEGTLSINRQDFEVGTADRDNNDAVSPMIEIKVAVTASRADAA